MENKPTEFKLNDDTYIRGKADSNEIIIEQFNMRIGDIVEVTLDKKEVNNLYKKLNKSNKILRRLFVDYKERGYQHACREVGLIDFKLSEIDKEAVEYQRELLASYYGCNPEEITDIKFHF